MKLFSRSPAPAVEPPAPPKAKRRPTTTTYDLTRLGEQIRAGEADVNTLHAWLWVYAANHGRPFRFNWSTDSRTLWDGGPDKLTRALGGLVRLGWIRVEEDEDEIEIYPTPGSAAIRG